MEKILHNEKDFIEYLFKYEDKKYKDFHRKLILSNGDDLIGIRMNNLKDIAKKISKCNFLNMFNYELELYEEKMILGLAIGYSNYSFNDILLYLDKYLCYIDNWGICDSVCSNLKQFKVNQEEGFKYINKLLHSNNEFDVRVAFVLLLCHYVNDKYIDEIIKIVYNYKSKGLYYIDMAISWLISVLYVYYPSKTIILFEKNTLSKFINNKAISKICDSFRVSKEDKNMLKGYRVK